MLKTIAFLLLILMDRGVESIQTPASCLMQPSRLTMQLPDSGFVWLDGEAYDGVCDTIPADKWVRLPSRTFDLFVKADGPSGSGRYWEITVGVANNGQTEPSRGFCLMTSTLGWRTLKRYKKLRWIDDLDEDTKPELMIWDSFPMSEEASLGGYGLMAWVYQVDLQGRFTIDVKLSRKMASEIARAYRKSLGGVHDFQEFRSQIADELDAFSTEACSTRTRSSR